MLFKDAGKLDLNVGNLDTLIKRPTKSLARTAIHNDKHYINTLIVKYPSGRCHTLKHRSDLGKDCFLRHLIDTLNGFLF